MKLKYLVASSFIVEHENVKILCDPWLNGPSHYGGWAHYPPYEFQPEILSDIDYVYVSHIHNDHLHHPTLKYIKKDIPVLIHKWPDTDKYVKSNLENLGFNVIELNHNERTHLKNNLYINILSAGNCDPLLCCKFLGCSDVETNYQASSIDTLCVIDNGDEVMINLNDCPFELAQFPLQEVKKKYNKIDLLLAPYSGAGPYPQCMKMSDKEYEIAIKTKKLKFFETSVKYIEMIDPKYYMPFTDLYTLAGKLWALNKHRGEPEMAEAQEYLSTHVDNDKHKLILLNYHGTFNIKTGEVSNLYQPINLDEKKHYIENVLSKNKLDFDDDSEPTVEEIIPLIPPAFERFEKRRKLINFSTDSVILVTLPEKKILEVPVNGRNYNIISEEEARGHENFVKISLDPKLLKRILKGPKYAHWQIADGGSFLQFERNPDIYERGLHFCLCFLHA